MSLQTRLSSLISAVGADVKALQEGSTTPELYNASTGNQNIATTGNVHLLGSTIVIPDGKIKVGTTYRCRFNATKTAAGTASPALGVRIGTAGNASDSTRVGLNAGATTAVVDEAFFDIEAAFRAIGASAVMQMTVRVYHRLSTTGLAVTRYGIAIATGPSWDATGTDLKVSTALGVGTSGNWTMNLVTAELNNLA